jgi:DHA2 family multidrug resistance protein-like MFS transporter
VSTVAITTVLSVLDGTISNVALPTIARELQVGSAAVVWVVNAFQLAMTMLLLPLSSCGDILGYARVYRAGVAIFVLASIGCATAHGLPELIAARAIQGIGAAAISATSQPISRFAFPAAMLGVAIGIQSLVVSISSAAGPAIGGFILGVASWPWLFWINVPFGILALALSGLLPAMPRASHRFDWWSAVLSGATLALFITGLDQLRAPANVTLFAVEIVAASIVGTVVVRRQLVLDPPFLAVDLLRIRVVWLSIVGSLTAFIAQNAALIVLPFYFLAFGYAVAVTGYLITPFAIGSALIALAAGRLADRYHAGMLGAVGMGLFATGMALIALLPAHAAMADIVWRTLLAGVGFGLFIPPNVRAIVAVAPGHRSGAVTGLTTSARLVGSTMGVTLAALIFSAGSSAGVVGDAAMRATLWAAAGLGVLTVAISLLRLDPAPKPARESLQPP